jgi:DNA-binding phage protein
MGAARPRDAAEHLRTQENVLAHLQAAFEEGDPPLIAAALGDRAHA